MQVVLVKTELSIPLTTPTIELKQENSVCWVKSKMMSIPIRCRCAALAVCVVITSSCSVEKFDSTMPPDQGWNGYAWGTKMSEILSASQQKNNFNFELGEECLAITSRPAVKIGNTRVFPWPVFKDDELIGVSYRGAEAVYSEKDLVVLKEELSSVFGEPAFERDDATVWRQTGFGINYYTVPNSENELYVFRIDMLSDDC